MKREEEGKVDACKESWKRWLADFVAENENIDRDSKSDTIICCDCDKNVNKNNYVRHRSINGCKNIDPRISLRYWKNQ